MQGMMSSHPHQWHPFLQHGTSQDQCCNQWNNFKQGFRGVALLRELIRKGEFWIQCQLVDLGEKHFNYQRNVEKNVAMAQNHQPPKWMVFPTKHDHFCGSFGTLILSHSHVVWYYNHNHSFWNDVFRGVLDHSLNIWCQVSAITCQVGRSPKLTRPVLRDGDHQVMVFHGVSQVFDPYLISNIHIMYI